MKRGWKIERVKLDQLKPNDWNPNKMDAKTYAKLKNNIRKFGYVNKIVVDEEGTIIDGYHRWKALQELGYGKVEVVVVSGLSRSEKMLLSINLNRLRGSDDPDLLFEIVSQLLDSDIEELEQLLAVDVGWLEKAEKMDTEIVSEEIRLLEPSLLKVRFKNKEWYEDVIRFLGENEEKWEKKIHEAVMLWLKVKSSGKNTQKRG